MKNTLILLFAVAIAVPFFAAGCGGPSIGDVCQQRCDCSGNCTAAIETSCENDGDEAQAAADKAGCSSEFSDMVSCANGAGCKDGDLDLGACAEQEAALLKCAPAITQQGAD